MSKLNDGDKKAMIEKIMSDPRNEVITFPPPVINDDHTGFCEQNRKIMAMWWGVSIDLVEEVMGWTIDGKHFPSFKLVDGYKFEDVIEHPSPNVTTYSRRVVPNTDGEES